MEKNFTFTIIGQIFFVTMIIVFLNLVLFPIRESAMGNFWILLSFVILGGILIKNILRELKIQEKIEFLIKRLNNANEQLKFLDKQKTEFISIASHQLRNPLTVISGYSSMILDEDFGKVPKNLKEPIARINNASSSLALLINDFLNISKIEKGEIEYLIDKVNLTEVLNNLFKEYEIMVKNHNLILRTKYNKNKNIFIKSDTGKLKQIFSNLFDNAIKYTIKGYIEIDMIEKNKKIIVSFKDTGIGISKREQDKIFNKFSRSEKANSVNVYGNGLGLYVSKVMTEAMNGRIWVESDGENKGTTFFVEFDVAE
jgi:signal transduction histidine kinase